MKKVLLTLCAIIGMTGSAVAQTVIDDVVDIETSDVKLEVISPAEQVQESKQEIKERKKRISELSDDVAYAKAVNSLKRGYFVVVADYIQLGHAGFRDSNINRHSNFVLVQGEDGIIQFAFLNGSPGVNGLGGRTDKGTVYNKRMKYEKNGDVHLTFEMSSRSMVSRVYVDVTVYHNSNQACVQVWGNYDMTFYGELLPYRDKDHK